jgi:ABC-type multidrug transport system fused ATPase/permease subunit
MPAVATILLVIVHQSLVASSAYFLTQTISQYQEDQNFSTPLVLYFLSMTLPFVPGCVSFITTQRWINVVHRKFCLAMAQAVYGKLEHYRDANRKAAFDSAISRNAFSTLSSYISLAHDFLSLALNSLLSILVIGVILPAEIVLGYGISLALSVGLVWGLSRLVKPLSVDTEHRYSHYGSTLHKAWDNMVLGNAYNSRLWRNEFESRSVAYYASSQKLVTYKQLGNIAIALASLVPTAYLVYQLLVVHGPEAGIIAAIIVNLTRIFHILNSLSALVYEWVEWTSATARLQYLFAFLAATPGEDLPLAPVGAITVNDAPITDYQTVCDCLRERRCGRLTIRGDNGAGKSTLLLWIKQTFPGQAYLLSPTHAQLCWRAEHGELSTGQRARAIIEEILQQDTKIQYLLLDEWDANLDQNNRQLIDQMLKAISKERVVVEVRH